MKTTYIRRDFLKKAAALAGTMALAPFVPNSIAGTSQSKGKIPDGKSIPRINPAFRIMKLNDGSIELFTYQKPGSKISYQYSGIEAGILLMIEGNKPPQENSKELASGYSLTDSNCRSIIDASMAQFEKKGLIYYGDLMIVKKAEKTYE